MGKNLLGAPKDPPGLNSVKEKLVLFSITETK